MSVLTSCEADPFTRADNASSMGSTPDGRAWTPLNTSGTFLAGINSNHAYCSDDAPGGKVVIDLENSEHDVKVKPFGFTAGTHFSPAVIFRHDPSGHAHYAIVAFTGSGANNHPQLFKFDSSNNGSFVQSWGAVTWASGDELRARCHGNLVDFYLAGSLIEANVWLDSGYSGYTRAGFRFEQVSGTSQYYDDWEACPVGVNYTIGVVRMN